MITNHFLFAETLLVFSLKVLVRFFCYNRTAILRITPVYNQEPMVNIIFLSFLTKKKAANRKPNKKLRQQQKNKILANIREHMAMKDCEQTVMFDRYEGRHRDSKTTRRFLKMNFLDFLFSSIVLGQIK